MKTTANLSLPLVALAIAGLAACSTTNRGTQYESSEEQTAQQQSGKSGKQQEQKPSQVSQEEATGDYKKQQDHLGTHESEGSTSVLGEREVTTTESFTADVPTVKKESIKADINRMGPDDFVALGLTDEAAKKIISYRDKRGPFASVEELKNIPGVDPTWIRKHQSQLGVSRQAAGAAGYHEPSKEHGPSVHPSGDSSMQPGQSGDIDEEVIVEEVGD